MANNSESPWGQWLPHRCHQPRALLALYRHCNALANKYRASVRRLVESRAQSDTLAQKPATREFTPSWRCRTNLSTATAALYLIQQHVTTQACQRLCSTKMAYNPVNPPTNSATRTASTLKIRFRSDTSASTLSRDDGLFTTTVSAEAQSPSATAHTVSAATAAHEATPRCRL